MVLAKALLGSMCWQCWSTFLQSHVSSGTGQGLKCTRGFDTRTSPGFNTNLAELFCLCVFIAAFWQYRLQMLRTPIAYVLPNTQSSSFPLFSALLWMCTCFSVLVLPHLTSQKSLPTFPLLQPSTADPLLFFNFPVLHINSNSHHFLGQGKCGHRAQMGRCFFIL